MVNYWQSYGYLRFYRYVKSHFWPISTKKYEIGQNIRVNGYKCFIFVPQLTTKKTNISWNFGENSTRWRHFIALCLHAISMGGVVPAFWGTHRDIKKRHWKKKLPVIFLIGKNESHICKDIFLGLSPRSESLIEKHAGTTPPPLIR